jgi:hypothetical protein
MSRRPHMVAALAALTAALAACTEEAPGPGIAVTVDLAGFAPASLKIAISAAPDGFVAHPRESVEGVAVTTEDVDGDGILELMLEFLAPPSPVTFRVATGNQIDLTVRGQALAFDETKIIAGADGTPVSLPAGGRGAVELTLAGREGGPIGPNTRTTDLKTVQADVSVGSSEPAGLAAIAVCDVDDDGVQDLVVGAPAAENVGLSVGAVYVLLGGGGLGNTIDVVDPTTVMEFHFFGADPGDRLGAAVACADVNGDGVGDVIAGAPGAGRVYAVFGGQDVRGRPITPGGTGAAAPDITWGTTMGGQFGAMLFAADLDGDRSAEILASAPMDRKVHLLRGVTERTPAPISVDGADHVTISNVRATALAAGNLRHLGGADIVIGDANAMSPGSAITRGAIYAYGSVPLAGTTQFDILASDVALAPDLIIYGDTEESTQFGAAVLVLDTTGGGHDLFVGAPGTASATGAVYVYEGDSALFDISPRMFMEKKALIAGPIAEGRFGAALAGTPSGVGPNWSSWDLLVGAYATGRADRLLAGAAYLFGGGGNREFPLYEQLFGASAGDQLGTVVAGGPINQSDPDGDLVTIAPGAADGRGIAYVRFNHVTQ